MFFACPACKQKSIFFTTKLLHVGGSTHHTRSNRFECTQCHSVLGCMYSPLPFLLTGVLLQLLITQSGSLRDLWVGGVLCAGVALFAFPIRLRPPEEQEALFGAVRRFNTPMDQGMFYVESRLLGLAAAILAGSSAFLMLTRLFPGAQAHVGGMILLLPTGIAAVLASVGYSALIHRIAQRSTPMRWVVDGILLVATCVVLWRW